MAGALEELHADFAGHELLAFGDRGLEHFALRRVPETVVDHVGVARDEAVAQVHHFAVHRDLLEAAVGEVQDGAAGSFVHAAGLQAHETVFDDVDAADGVVLAERVELAHDVRRGEFLAVDLLGNTLFKVDDHVFRGVGGLGKRLGHHGDLFRELVPRVFEDAALEADVQQIAVHAVRLGGGGGDRDAVLLRVFDEVHAAREIPLAPRGDDLDVRLHRIGGQLEADLVVALAGRAVADRVGAFGAGDFDQALADQGTGDGGAEQVVAFVDRVGLHHREDEVAGELFIQVLDVAFGRSGADRLGFNAVELLLLADVGAEADHLGIVLFFDPLDDHGGVKSAGIGDDYFHLKLLGLMR